MRIRLFSRVLSFGKFLVETIDAAVGLDETLLASVERVAIAAGINLDFFEGAASFEGSSTGNAGDSAFLVIWMDVVLHKYSFRLATCCRKESYG